MDNIQLLFEHNKGSFGGCKVFKSKIWLNFSHSTLDAVAIRDILYSVQACTHKYKQKVPIVLRFTAEKVQIEDKLTYIILECVCYSIINDCKRRMYVIGNFVGNIITDGICDSPLRILNRDSSNMWRKFVKNFEFVFYKNHFRKIV